MLGMMGRLCDGRLVIMLDSWSKDFLAWNVLSGGWRRGFWCWVWDILKWLDLAEVLSVTLCDGPGAVNADMVAVVRANLYNYTSLIPSARVLAALVLDSYLVTSLERLQRFAGLEHFLTFGNVSLGISSSTVSCSLSPLLTRLKLSWLKR